MAWSRVALPAAEQSAYQRDAPLIIGGIANELYSVLPQWRYFDTVGGQTAVHWTNGVAANHATYLPAYGHTRTPWIQTRPQGPGTGTVRSWSYVMDFGADSGFEIDSIVILNHNFSSLPSDLVVSVQFADSSDFATNTVTLVTWSSPFAARLVDLRLTAASVDYRYTSVQYARITFGSATGNMTSSVPQFGFVALGRQRQLSHRSLPPYDDNQIVDESSDFVADSGAAVRYIKNQGGRMVDARWNLGSADLGGLDHNAQILAWRRDFGRYSGVTQYGILPSIWIERPLTAPGTALLMMPESILSRPLQGFVERSTQLVLREIPPYFEVSG